jgi:hypothetical protein
MKKKLINSLMIILLVVSATQLSAQTAVQYYNLGSGGGAKVSNNGTYVCGNNYPSPSFVWSEATGKITLGTGYSEAMGVSNNGIVAGSFTDTSLHAPNGNPTLRAGYYDGTRWMPLEGYPGYPVLDEMTYNYGYGISSDGAMIVGMQWLPIYKAEACYWDSVGAIHMLGRTGGQSSCAYDVAKTSSGFRIIGWDGESSGPDRRPFYWDPQPHFMGGYDSTYPAGQCNGLNSGGSKIVGGSTGALFVWTEGQGMTWFNTTYLNYASYSKDISDNDIIVGYVSIGVGNYHGFIKRPEWSDILLIENYLVDSLGIAEASDWLNSFVNSISNDGLTITGTAYPISGGPIAYVLKFSDPLPVELTSFSASLVNNKVLLNWSTKSELNNQGFVIERKIQNLDWYSIGTVPGNGTTTEIKNYQLEDNSVSTNKYYYRLKQIDFGGSYKYSNDIEVDVNSVSEFSLNQNYPNPFNPSTKISFSLAQSSNVKLSVFNMLGEKIVELLNEVKSAGTYDVNFDGSELSTGMYLYRIESGNNVLTKKMILIK